MAKRKRRRALPLDYDDELAASTDTTGTDDDYTPPKPPTPPQLRKKTGMTSFSVGRDLDA